MDAPDSLVDRVVKELQRQIADGCFRPGQRLPAERSLSTSFQVGRTTVREALKSLAVQGMVARTPRGAVVVDPREARHARADMAALAAQSSIRDLYELRKLIEVRVAGWAAQRASAEDAERLRALVEAGHPDNDEANPNSAFHDALVEAAHNPVLTEVYGASRGYFLHLPFYWRLFRDDEVKSARAWRHELARRWHRHILQAVEQHDPAEAEGAMFQHLDLMEKDLLGRLRSSNGNGTVEPAHPMLAEIP